ncbi:hypothetical protein Tco_1362745 [Tanacetum coccineum]
MLQSPPVRRAFSSRLKFLHLTKKTCNNDKNLSEIQLEHEERGMNCGGGGVTGGRNMDCKMVVKEIVGRLLEEEEKLEWWFEQDIDKEEERFEGDEDGGEVGGSRYRKRGKLENFLCPVLGGQVHRSFANTFIFVSPIHVLESFPIDRTTLDEEETFWEGEEDELEGNESSSFSSTMASSERDEEG